MTMWWRDLAAFLSSAALVRTSRIHVGVSFLPIHMPMCPFLWLTSSHLQQQGVLCVLLKLLQTSCHVAGGEFTIVCWFEGLLSPTESTILNQILLEACTLCFTCCHLELPPDMLVIQCLWDDKDDSFQPEVNVYFTGRANTNTSTSS